MKKSIVLLLIAIVCISCEQRDVCESAQLCEESRVEESRLCFSSMDELSNIIQEIESGDNSQLATRSINKATIQPMEFVSLYDAKKAECLSKLTPLQLDSINHDPDQLEFCLNDSIVASEAFAKVLNENREIQVGDNVYKYIGNGVIYTSTTNSKKLLEFDEKLLLPKSDFVVNDGPITLNNGVNYIPTNYLQNSSSISSANQSVSEGLKLKDGTLITNVKEVDYAEGGEGSWFYNLSTGIAGENVVAYKYFNETKRRMRFESCNQNYIVYAYTGINAKMQKKVCGIWWNTPAEDIRIGWSAIEFMHTFDKPLIMQAPELDKVSFIKAPSTFGSNKDVLIHLPADSYDFYTSNLSTLLNNGLKTAMKNFPKELVSELNKIIKEEDLHAFTPVDNHLYVLLGGYELNAQNKKELSTKFYSQFLPGNYEVGIGYNGSFGISSIKLDGGNEIDFRRGSLYGAVKYNGAWQAIRITKTVEQE